MPIYDQTYRAFDGEVRRHFRWWQIVRQEWSVLTKSRLVRLFGLMALGVFGLHLFYIYAVAALLNQQDHPFAEFARNAGITQIDGSFFLRFIRLETPLVLITTLLTGAAMICNDFRYNLVEVYFSKPLSWLDYVLGKSVTLILVAFTFTLFPAVLLQMLFVLLTLSWEAALDMLKLVPAIFLSSSVLALSCTMGVLASSCIFNSRSFASIAIFMLLIFNSAFGSALPEILREEGLRIIAYPVALNRLHEWFFDAPNLFFDVPVSQALIFVGGFIALCTAILCQKARRAGAAA